MTRAARLALSFFCAFVLCAGAAEVNVPKQVKSGDAVTISTRGSGKATLIVVGPASAWKTSVKLGDNVKVDQGLTAAAGQYTVSLAAADGNASAVFFVVAGAADKITFLAQPSRVPVARPQAISGTAFVMDANNNVVTIPTNVNFQLAVPDSKPVTRSAASKDGIAWVRMDSGHREGSADFTASDGTASTRRVVRQVASDPCNLRIHAQPGNGAILVQTDPVRDCSGNSVPDGTIVTFTQVDPSGKSTVDARVKRGVAKAEMPAANNATISVASGVVVGNELRVGGGR